MFSKVIILLILTTFFCFLSSFLARKINLVDEPDGLRKKHDGHIPLSGGIAIFLSFLSSALIFGSFSQHFFMVMSCCTLLILILGTIDDKWNLSVSIRIIIQILASWIVISFTDVYISNLGDLFGLGNIYLGQLGIPITIFMVVGVTNAFNMFDGFDGSVSSVAILAFSSLFLLSLFNGARLDLFFFLVPIVFIFLLFNMGFLGTKRKIFLGDGGALSLGFFLSWSLIFLSQGNDPVMRPVIALWIIFLPLIDALSTFLIRIKARQPIFLGDRKHMHFLLIDNGLSENKVFSIFFIISLLTCSFAIFSSIYSFQESYLFYGFVTLWTFYLLIIKYPFVKSDSV